MNSLKIPTFMAYFLTNTMSLLGTWIQKVGLGWLAWQITESTFWTSLISLLLMAPVGFLGPFIAVFAESWETRRAMFITKILMVAISALIYFFQILEMHNIFTLVVFSTILGLLGTFHHPIRLVFISLVVPKPFLASAVGMNSVSWNLSRIAGPAIAGITIHSLGLSATFLFATVLYLPLIITLFFLALQPRQADQNETNSFIKKMIDGGTVVLKTPIIFTTLCIVSLNSFFVRGVLEIQPAIVGQVLGGDGYALATVTAAAGFGSLLASIWIGFGNLDKIQIQKFLCPMVVVGILVTSILYIAGKLVPMSIIFIVIGFTATITGIGAQTVIQLEVEDKYRARVMTWWSTISFGSLVLGGMVVGFLGDLMNIEQAILILMLIGSFITVWFYIHTKKVY